MESVPEGVVEAESGERERRAEKRRITKGTVARMLAIAYIVYILASSLVLYYNMGAVVSSIKVADRNLKEGISDLLAYDLNASVWCFENAEGNFSTAESLFRNMDALRFTNPIVAAMFLLLEEERVRISAVWVILLTGKSVARSGVLIATSVSLMLVSLSLIVEAQNYNRAAVMIKSAYNYACDAFTSLQVSIEKISGLQHEKLSGDEARSLMAYYETVRKLGCMCETLMYITRCIELLIEMLLRAGKVCEILNTTPIVWEQVVLEDALYDKALLTYRDFVSHMNSSFFTDVVICLRYVEERLSEIAETIDFVIRRSPYVDPEPAIDWIMGNCSLILEELSALR